MDSPIVRSAKSFAYLARTVGSHLDPISPKLDITSRNELAALMKSAVAKHE